MPGEAAFTLAVVVLALLLMVREHLPPDILLLAALGVLVAGGAVDLETALGGFAHPTLLAIGALFVTAAAFHESGVLEALSGKILGRSRRPRAALARLTSSVAVGSAFLNNTAIVAMGVPAVLAWCRERRVAPSKFLIPLSYASVLGGLCTLIGTSTNLVSHSLLEAHGLGGLAFFELAIVGVPCLFVGLAYLVVIAPRLLPERQDLRASRTSAGAESEVATTTVSRGELRAVVEVSWRENDDEGAPPVLFDGATAVLERDSEDAAPRTHHADNTQTAAMPATTSRVFREAVVPPGSPLANETIRGAHIDARYGATTKGVRRGKDDVADWDGDFVLRPGDALLLETEPSSDDAIGRSPDLIPVDAEAGATPATGRQVWADEPRSVSRRSAAWICCGALLAAILLATFDVLPIAVGALLAAVLLLALRIVSPGNARRSVNWSVLITIGAALGVSAALETSGAAAVLGDAVMWCAEHVGARGLLAATVVATMLMTLIITNTAAVALMFPVILASAGTAGLDPRPLVIASTIAASLAFATPLSYQTNLMVYAPGGYRFGDFVRVGLPLQLLLGAVPVVVVPLFWPLS